MSRLLARYRAEGQAAFEPRSRRPRSSPTAIGGEVVDLIVRLRKELTDAGLDAGAATIEWHLAHHHGVTVSVATINRYLAAGGLVVAAPKKKPKSAFARFEADQPNQCWQADFTDYRLSRPDGRPGADAEILSWLDDHARFALSVTAYPPSQRADRARRRGVRGLILTWSTRASSRCQPFWTFVVWRRPIDWTTCAVEQDQRSVLRERGNRS